MLNRIKLCGVVAVAALAFALSSNAHAVIIAQYNLGENDAGAAAGNVGNNPTTAAIGDNLIQLGNPTYSSDTPAGGSTLSMDYDGTGDYYYGSAPTTDFSQDLSISFDAKGANGAGGFSFLASLGGNFGGFAVVEIGGVVQAFTPGTSGGITSGAGFDLDGDTGWHHYDLEWTAATTTLALSVDNVLVSTRVTNPAANQIVDAFTIGGNYRLGPAATAAVRTAADFEGSFNGVIDNVVVSQVPEPASLALLGLGGLLLIRRKH